MTEEELILKSFDKIFSEYKKEEIVIYGTGFRTKFIIENFLEYKFVGIIDKGYKYDYFHGIPIFTIDKVCKIKPKLIIIMAQQSSTKKIFKRISYHCLKNNIKVCNFHGRDLFDLYKYNKTNMLTHKYLHKNKTDFIYKIKQHDSLVVSIKDVLFTTNYLNKKDFYKIIATKSQELGIEKSKIFFSKLGEYIENSIPYDEIYNIVGKRLFISQKTLKYLMEFEINLWEKMIVFREDILDGIKYAISKNKNVYLYNDTGYSDFYIKKIIVKKIKIDQNCFNIVNKSYFNDILESTLFLKLDEKEDIINPKCSKFEIKSSYDMLKISAYADLLVNAKALNDRSIVAMFASCAFNSPFTLFGTDGILFVDNIKTFGSLFICPIVTKFILWMIEVTNLSKYDEILFAARDGYLIQVLFNIAQKYIKMDFTSQGLYFKTSRTVCSKAYVKDKEDIKWICELPFAYSPEEVLIRRFEVNKELIKPYDNEIYETIFHYALEYEKNILIESMRIRENYLNYIKKLKLVKGKKYAFVDFVSSGTCQHLLNKITDFDLEGMYLCKYMTTDNNKNQLNIKSLFNNGFLFYGSKSYLAENYMLLETIFTSFEPTLISFDKEGRPIYAEETRKEEEFLYVKNLHDCIKKYFEYFIENIFIDSENISEEFVDYVYSLKDFPYTRDGCDELDNIMLRDDFGQGMIPLLRK